jgi:hypothetical protein
MEESAWEADSSSADKEIPHTWRNQMFITVFTSRNMSLSAPFWSSFHVGLCPGVASSLLP